LLGQEEFMSVALASLSPPVPRVAGLALAALAPIAIGGVMAQHFATLQPIFATPLIVFGVLAATCPALYIATAVTGDAPPVPAMARALATALAAFGIALAGLVLPTAFLSLSSLEDSTTRAACTIALAGAALVACRRLAGELDLRTLRAISVFTVWVVATLVIAGRLWWDLAATGVMP
jgi:hypothetical protein